MSAKTTAVKLTEQRQGGRLKCYRKMIGGRRFYLTADRRDSERLAMALLTAWRQLDQAGQGWTEESIDAAYRLAGIERERVQRVVVGTQRLYAAMEEYLTEYRGRVSPARYQRQVVALNALKRHQRDVPLRLVGWNRLSAIVDHFRGRPQTQHGVPMAVATVATTLKSILAFFDWADVSGRWESPRRFERLFRLKYAAMKTPLELRREGQGPDVFSVAELIKLWQVATERQRLYLGLALNIGETAQGLADLQSPDLRLDADRILIDRHRGKTGVKGVYPLWPEVAALVTRQREQGGDGTPMFLTTDDKPLVWYCENGMGRVDSIAKTWTNLIKKAGVRKLGFATLRKTGASIIREIGGLEVSQTYLSHKGQTVAEKHYLTRSFAQLADALDRMRVHLEPMFRGDLTTDDTATAAA